MKFSLICPTFNMEAWIAETIESVLTQEGDFEIEFILADGASKDGTVQIFESYRQKVESGTWLIRCNGISMSGFSEKDSGTFDAINKGFARATGDFGTWLDADNTLAPGALAGLAAILTAYPDIEWVKGYSSTMDESGNQTRLKQSNVYRQDWLQDGVYGMESYFVQADTVFWSRALWQKSGPIPTNFRCSGEYWLWMQMARHAPLWSSNLHISNYRKREGQLSGDNRCQKERISARPKRSLKAWQARLFFSPQSRLYPHGEKFFLWLYPKLFMQGNKKIWYIDFELGKPVKKQAKTFIIGSKPSYKNLAI